MVNNEMLHKNVFSIFSISTTDACGAPATPTPVRPRRMRIQW